MKASDFIFTNTKRFNNPHDMRELEKVYGPIARQIRDSDGHVRVPIDNPLRSFLWNEIAWRLRDDGWIVKYIEAADGMQSGPFLDISHPHLERIVPDLGPDELAPSPR